MAISRIRLVYLALAVWGAVHPMIWLGGWMLENGLDLPTLIAAWIQSKAATGLFWDLLISAVVLTIWVCYETWVLRRWHCLLAIPATFCIGVSCGLPLYLFLRSRPMD